MYSSWTIPVGQTKHLNYTAAKLINVKKKKKKRAEFKEEFSLS